MVDSLLHIENELTKDDLLDILRSNDKDALGELFCKADEIRKTMSGDEVQLSGTIKISNHCEENCVYCGLREENFSLSRYRMEPDEIIEIAKHISNLGIRSIIIQSGNDSFFDTDLISYLLYSIKQHANISITLALGKRGFDEYRAWKIAGADKYIINFEPSTSSEKTNPSHIDELSSSKQHLMYLKRIGYEVGTASVIGLPTQTPEMLADGLLAMKELDLDYAEFTAFMPSSFTPLQNTPSADLNHVLKILALARILLKDVKIPAMQSLDCAGQNGRELALKRGANFLIQDFTPEDHLKKYQVFSKKCDKTPELSLQAEIKRIVKSAGRKLRMSNNLKLLNFL